MRRGSVMLEFILMMPVLLLLLGGTVLTFEILVGKLRLQESNRNLAWLSGDRFNYGKKAFEKKIYKTAEAYFEDRNVREKAIDSAGGELYKTGGNKTMWGLNVSRKQTADGSTYNGATDWSQLMVGNMEVRMQKVSAAYMGAIAVSSVLHGDDGAGGRELYRSSYDLTHTPAPKSAGMVGDGFLPEAFVLRRMPYIDIDGKPGDESAYRAANYVSEIWGISLEPWPKKEDQSMVSSGAGTSDKTEYKRVLYDFTQ